MLAPPGDHRAVLNGARLRYLEWGDREAPNQIIALHGFGQTADFLSSFVEALAHEASVHVVAPDLRAHGDSDDFSGGPADTVLAEDAVALWRATVGREAIWFGNSLGARIAALAAARHPEIAHRLVLGECIAGLEDLWALLSAATRRYASVRPASFPSRAAAHTFAEKVRRDKGAALDLWISHGVHETDDGALADKLRTGFLDKSYWPVDAAALTAQLGSIAVPVVLAYGARASAVSPPNQERVRRFFREARIEHIPEAGHNLFLDAPLPLARLVLADPPRPKSG